MFILKEIYAKNFRSYPELHIVDMDSMGLTLISGRNGAGKSAIRHLLEYILTDNFSDDLSVSELTFNKNGNCEMMAKFIRDDNTEIKIWKYREHKEYGNKSFILLDGEIMENLATDRREVKKQIEELFGIGANMLGVSTIFSKGSPSFPQSSEADRKEVIYSIEDFSKYDEWHSNTKEEISKLKKSIEKHNNSIDNIKEQIESIENDIKESEESANGFKEEIQEEIKKTQDYINLKKENIEKTKNKVEELNNKFVDIDEEYYKKLRITIESLKSELASTKGEISIVEKELKKVSSGVCPILKEECNRLIDVSKEYKPRLKKLYNSVSKYENDIEDQEKELNTIENNVKNNKQIENDISMSEMEIKNRNEVIENLEQKIEESRNKKNPYIDIVNKLKDKLKKKKEELAKEKEELEKENYELPYLEFWLTGFSRAGIPNLKSERLLDEIERKTNENLSSLSDDMHIEIESQKDLKSKKEKREAVSYKVFSPYKTITDFFSYSEGQKQRVLLADKFAFNSLLGNFNFIMFDEILELSLDDLGKERVISFLRNKVNEIGNILVISHDPTIKDSFDTVINIKSREGISEVE